MNTNLKKQQTDPAYTVISLFIIMFYISFIESYRLLAITGIIVSIHSIVTCKNKFFIRLTKPVLPFVILMLLPMIIRYFINGTIDNLDFTIMIICKVLISAIMLGTIVSKYSALYLVDGILNVGLPQIFNRILALTFRYFHMIQGDIEKGKRALVSRGFNERKALASLSIFGEWIGGFFLKSSNHSDMVFNAMKSRGFQGKARNARFKQRDLIIKSFALILFLGIILMIDRKIFNGC